MNKFLIVSCLCALLMACQHSPRKNYYYLSSVNERSTMQHTASENLQLIGIGPVDVAEYLARSQIIDNQTDNTITLSENAYWAEPLDKSIARVISLNLTQMNNSRSFVNFPWRSDAKPKYSLRLRIDELSRNGRNANINATWELIDIEAKKTIVRNSFIRSTAAESGAKGLAAAYSQLLAELSKEVDKALSM